MVKELSIILDQDKVNRTYVPGTAVTGSLIIDITQPRKYKQIAVFLKGTGTVEWANGQLVHHSEPGPKYRAAETYVNEQKVLWRKEDSPNGTLPPGVHTYPFELQLPANCPSSYKSELGKISYLIEGVVSAGKFKSSKKVQHPIKVLERVTANSTSTLPIREQKRKSVRNWLCMSGQITCDCELERDAFNVGEEIPVSFYVENGSGRLIIVRYALVETLKHHTPESHRTLIIRRELLSSTYINPHKSGQQFVRLPIPNDLRPAMTRATIVESEYTVNVTLEIPWARNLITVFPVSIGNQDSQQLSETSQL